jgi:type 1 glutamine amidotransferase
MDIYYAQGPLLAPAEVADLPDFEVLAYYRTEIAKNGAPSGVMVDTPAVVAAPFGRGRVLCLSPHFEKAASEKRADAIVRRAVLWVAGRAENPTRAAEGRKAG